MKKNVGLANTASNCFISQTTYYIYEATNILFTFENRGGALKQNWKKKLLGSGNRLNITSTYYVHETTNTRFTFENCGGCLKQN